MSPDEARLRSSFTALGWTKSRRQTNEGKNSRLERRTKKESSAVYCRHKWPTCYRAGL